MKPFSLVILMAVFFNTHAQTTEIYAGTEANSFFITAGESLSVAGLTLTPSSNFNLTDNHIIKNTVVTNSANQPYAPIVYKFAKTTAPFSGIITINYTGVNLTGFTESNLRLQYHNGSSWVLDGTSTVSIGTDFVSSGTFSSTTLNELTISDVITSLPIHLLSFTAEPKNNQSLIRWTTATEQNTQSFAVMHSTDGVNWAKVGMIDAAGNSSIATSYNFIHSKPALNNIINYYKLIQILTNGNEDHSGIITLKYGLEQNPVSIRPNPTGETMNIHLEEPQEMILYNAVGAVVSKVHLTAGINNLSVSHLPRGTYIAKFRDKSIRLILN